MRRQVSIGDRYRDCTALWCQWQVSRIYLDFFGVPHAVVTNVQDGMERRTLACPTLLDHRRYRRVDDDEPTDLTELGDVAGQSDRVGGLAATRH